jgi:hypothetical protein
VGTGAVSLCKLDRSQKIVLVQKFDYVQWRESGFSSHNEFVLGAGAKVEERSDEIPPRRGKNRDKQLTLIVRVSTSNIILKL